MGTMPGRTSRTTRVRPAAVAPAPPPGGGFAGVAGHGRAVAHLQAQMQSGSLAHAHLFIGESRIGKTTLARALAEEMLVRGGSPKRLEWHPDFWLDDRVEPLKIDEIRFQAADDRIHHQTLQQFLALRPFAGGSRVAVLANADRMTDEAANCLLKTLEEPPPQSVLILTTTRPDRLVPTVVSRTQQLALSPLTGAEVRDWLVRAGVAAARAVEIAGLARGRIGWALAAAGGSPEWTSYQAWLQDLIEISAAPPLRLLEYAQRFGEDREAAQREAKAREALEVWQLWLRDALLASVGAPELVVHRSQRDALGSFATRWSPGQLATMLQLSLEAQQRVEQHVNPRLALTVFLLEAFQQPVSP